MGEWHTLPLHHSLPVLGNIEYLGVERRQVHLVPVVTVPAQLVAELGAEQPQLRQLEQHVGEHGRLGRVVARHLQLDGLDQLVLDCLDAALVRQPDSLWNAQTDELRGALSFRAWLQEGRRIGKPTTGWIHDGLAAWLCEGLKTHFCRILQNFGSVKDNRAFTNSTREPQQETQSFTGGGCAWRRTPEAALSTWCGKHDAREQPDLRVVQPQLRETRRKLEQILRHFTLKENTRSLQSVSTAQITFLTESPSLLACFYWMNEISKKQKIKWAQKNEIVISGLQIWISFDTSIFWFCLTIRCE